MRSVKVSMLVVAISLAACGGAVTADTSATTETSTGATATTVGGAEVTTTQAEVDSGAVASIAPGTAEIAIGDRTWLFTTEDGPGARCTVDLDGDGGIVAIGYEIDADGMPIDGATLEVNIYGEDWVPQGKQANSVSVSGSADQPDWSTAGVTRIEDNPGISGLADATVTSWRLSGGESTGSVTFYDEDSLTSAQAGGDLVLADGSFEIHCAGE